MYISYWKEYSICLWVHYIALLNNIYNIFIIYTIPISNCLDFDNHVNPECMNQMGWRSSIDVRGRGGESNQCLGLYCSLLITAAELHNELMSKPFAHFFIRYLLGASSFVGMMLGTGHIMVNERKISSLTVFCHLESTWSTMCRMLGYG